MKVLTFGQMDMLSVDMILFERIMLLPLNYSCYNEIILCKGLRGFLIIEIPTWVARIQIAHSYQHWPQISHFVL